MKVLTDQGRAGSTRGAPLVQAGSQSGANPQAVQARRQNKNKMHPEQHKEKMHRAQHKTNQSASCTIQNKPIPIYRAQLKTRCSLRKPGGRPEMGGADMNSRAELPRQATSTVSSGRRPRPFRCRGQGTMQSDTACSSPCSITIVSPGLQRRPPPQTGLSTSCLAASSCSAA